MCSAHTQDSLPSSALDPRPQNEEDYDYDGASSSEKYSADYDYGYDFTGSDYTDYVEPGTPPQRATPPPRIGRRSLE